MAARKPRRATRPAPAASKAPDSLEEKLAQLQAKILSVARTRPAPRWGRVHEHLRTLHHAPPADVQVRSAFLVPLA